MKILLTGANGFVGYYLTQQLIGNGHTVIATGKGECRTPFQPKNLIYETLDFTNQESVEKMFIKYQPYIVVHCGAISKPDECELNKENAFLTNVTGTIYLLDEAARKQCFFIFLSTDFVFDGEKGMYKEEDERNPVNYYGQTKLLAEDEVMRFKGNWAIIRTVLVYGKTMGGRENIITNTVKALKKGERLRIFHDQIRTPTYVEDLVKGIVLVIEKNAKGIYHISGEDIKTPYEMAVAAAEHLDLDTSLIEKITEADLQQAARRPAKTGFNINKAKRELGFRPVSFDEGLRKTLE